MPDPREHYRYRCPECDLKLAALAVVERRCTLNLADDAIQERGYAYIYPKGIVCQCGFEMLLEKKEGRVYR